MKFVEGSSEFGYSVWLYTRDHVFYDVLRSHTPSRLRIWMTKIKLLWLSAFAA